MDSRGIDYTCLTLIIIGAVNWGLIGFFKFDLVANCLWPGRCRRTLYAQHLRPYRQNGYGIISCCFVTGQRFLYEKRSTVLHIQCRAALFVLWYVLQRNDNF